MTTPKIAMLGSGAMGSRVAHNLIKAGYSVIVYNRTQEKVTDLITQGATYAATPQAAAAQADIVISMVTDNEVSRSVWLT
jgi:3-hydroxyisobutyrate dehydrogenase-like beta-hydroxyacid dehydrogenase